MRDLWGALDFRLGGGSAINALAGAERDALSAAPVQLFERELVERLADAVSRDGLSDLADVVAEMSRSRARVVVFCGRGTLARELQGPWTPGVIRFRTSTNTWMSSQRMHARRPPGDGERGWRLLDR